MKYVTAVIITIFFTTVAFANKQEQKIDLELKKISYQNESIPTLSIDFTSKELHQFDFIVAFASDYFELQKPSLNEEKRKHFYLGFNYKF